MPFIGKQPEVGAYQLIDSITTSATDTYALTVDGSAYFPASARNLIVSLNGVTQAPESAYTVSGSNIVFDSALTSSDVIDYILVIGDAVDIGTPSDGTVGTAQMSYPLGNFSSTGIDDNATSTAITIDSSENVGIGTTSPSQLLHLSSTGAVKQRYTRSANSTDISLASNGMFNADNLAATGFGWYNNGTEAMRINSSGNVGIGTNSNIAGINLEIKKAGAYLGLNSTTAGYSLVRGYDNGTERWSIGQIGFGGADGMAFYTGSSNTERMRIDASGNVMVGTTDYTLYDNTTGSGFAVTSSGRIYNAVTSNSAQILNRMSTDGTIADFRKDGTTVGSIGTGDGSSIFIECPNSTKTGLDFRNDILPRKSGALSDGTTSLGAGSYRFDDIYATNGTIQTSDANEKQDIEALSEAETRVAVAAKALLRKFRWKSMVRTKSHDARIHFGIIAQDLQAAFEAEGLDAGDYGMFTHSTWTDEETGEERSRMGVRYSELLAFIIAAI